MSTLTEQQLREYLAGEDVPCPSCDYNLRGLTSDRCPECNQRLVLRVGLAEPRLGAFVAATVGLAMGAGFSGLLALYGAVRLCIEGGMRGIFFHFFVLTLPFFLVECVALWFLIRARRRFSRKSELFKGLAVTAAWMVTLAGFMVFTFNIK